MDSLLLRRDFEELATVALDDVLPAMPHAGTMGAIPLGSVLAMFNGKYLLRYSSLCAPVCYQNGVWPDIDGQIAFTSAEGVATSQKFCSRTLTRSGTATFARAC